MFQRIDHVEIIPSDFERTIAFYSEVLGFSMEERQSVDSPPMKEIAFLRLGDTVLELISVKDPHPMSKEAYQVGYKRHHPYRFRAEKQVGPFSRCAVDCCVWHHYSCRNYSWLDTRGWRVLLRDYISYRIYTPGNCKNGRCYSSTPGTFKVMLYLIANLFA